MGELDMWMMTEEDQKKEMERKEIEEKQKQIDEVKRKQGYIESFKQAIKGEGYLWDMRCWDKYKNPDEILAWFENDFEPNNCGHAVYCIKELLGSGTTKEEIISLMLSNDSKKYSKRLAKCFGDGMKCERYAKCGNYKDCNCSQCEGD
jgi:superfamily II helicase